LQFQSTVGQARGMAMMRKNVLLGAGAVSALVVTALLLTMTASAAKTRAAGQSSCYPNNEFQINPGDTHANLSNVFIQSTSVEIEPNYNSSVGRTFGKGWEKVNMGFDAFDGGPLLGHASADFAINGRKGHFESRCIAEAQTEADGDECGGCTDEFEAEFEGTVSGLPFSPKPQNGILSLSGWKAPNGDIVLHFNIEQGTTCDEYKGEFGASNEDHAGKTSGSLKADDTQSGRWGVPDGFDPSLEEPCQDVFA
jgi:hypothetical protein